MVAEPRDDKEPNLGRVEEVDDAVAGMESLRTTDDDPHVASDIPAASGLTTRDHPPSPDPEGGEDEPGSSLRRAREAAGLDTATLGRRIHLGRGTLEDLEANRFHHMAPAYVRGYLRACARELGVNAEPWIRAFETHGVMDPELRAVATPSARTKGRRRSSAPYWLALLLLLGLLGLGVYTWSERGGGTPAFPSLGWTEGSSDAASGEGAEMAREPESTPDDNLVAPPALVETPEPGSDEEADSEASISDEDPEPQPAVETLAEPVRSEDTTAAETDTEEATETSTTAGPISEMALLTGGGSVSEQDSTPAESEAGEADRDGLTRLVLEVDETSWVEVRDVDDQIVFTGVLSGGDREELELALPGRVVLGNARGVQLALDGEPFDFDAHIRGDRTARFDLEP